MGDGVSEKALYPSSGRGVYHCLSLKDGWKAILFLHTLMNINTPWTTEPQIYSIGSSYTVTDSTVKKKKKKFAQA